MQEAFRGIDRETAFECIDHERMHVACIDVHIMNTPGFPNICCASQSVLANVLQELAKFFIKIIIDYASLQINPHSALEGIAAQSNDSHHEYNGGVHPTEKGLQRLQGQVP